MQKTQDEVKCSPQRLKQIKILIVSPSCRSLKHEACRLRGLLLAKSGNASRKKDFRFPTKEQTSFQIEKAEQCCALQTEPEHGRRHEAPPPRGSGTPGNTESKQLIPLILYGIKGRTWEIHVEHEVSSAVLSHCVHLFRKGWISFRWWRRKRFLLNFIS